MHSLLRRWLHKYHRLTHQDSHSSVSKDARERLEPIGILNKYVCEELAGEYAKYWAKIREEHGEGLEEIQRNALNCWHAFWFNFGERTEQPSLPLDFVVEVFDDYFFLGSLRLRYTSKSSWQMREDSLRARDSACSRDHQKSRLSSNGCPSRSGPVRSSDDKVYSARRTSTVHRGPILLL